MIRHITPELAELVGIIIGDGHIGWYPKLHHFRVTISCNSQTDLVFIEKYVKPLIKKLFNINPEIYFQPNEKNVKCRFYSKSVAEKLINLGIPFKDKTHKVKIPEKIKSDKNLLKCCIRGIFDTDGSFFNKYGNYAQIGIRSYSKLLQKDLNWALRSFSFHPSLDKKQNYLFIHRQKEIINFFTLIGSSNPKHIVKFLEWIKTNNIPRINKTLHLINNFKGKLPFYFKKQ